MSKNVGVVGRTLSECTTHERILFPHENSTHSCNAMHLPKIKFLFKLWRGRSHFLCCYVGQNLQFIKKYSLYSVLNWFYCILRKRLNWYGKFVALYVCIRFWEDLLLNPILNLGHMIICLLVKDWVLNFWEHN